MTESKIDYLNLTNEEYKKMLIENEYFLNGLTQERIEYIRDQSNDKGYAAQLLGHIDKLNEEIKKLKIQLDHEYYVQNNIGGND